VLSDATAYAGLQSWKWVASSQPSTRREPASSGSGLGARPADDTNKYSSKVQQCPRYSVLSNGGSATFSAPQRGIARSMPSLCKQGVRGSSPLGSTLVKSTFGTAWRSDSGHLQQQTAAVGP
jgi:hypothetical protein